MEIKKLTSILFKKDNKYYIKRNTELIEIYGFYCLSFNETKKTKVKVYKDLKSFIKSTWIKCINSKETSFMLNIYILNNPIGSQIGFYLQKDKNSAHLYSFINSRKELIAIISIRDRKVQIINTHYTLLFSEVENYLPKRRNSQSTYDNKNSVKSKFVSNLRSFGIYNVNLDYITQKKLLDINDSIIKSLKDIQNELQYSKFKANILGLKFYQSKKSLGYVQNEILFLSSITTTADLVIFNIYHEYGHLLHDKLIMSNVDLNFISYLKTMPTLKYIESSKGSKFGAYMYQDDEIFARLFEQYMGELYTPYLLNNMKEIKEDYWYFTKEEMQIFYKFIKSIKKNNIDF